MSKTERCPICSRPAAVKLRPFCSERCADVDLGRWLDNSYAIPVEEDEHEFDDASGAGAGQERLA